MTQDVVGIRYVDVGHEGVVRRAKQFEGTVDSTVRSMKVAVNQTNQNAKSLDRLTRDVLKAEREMQRLAKALARGAIESGQFQGEVNRIAARLRALGLDRAQSETLRYARAQATLARETEQVGNAIVQQSAQVQTAMRGQAQATMFASRAQNASGMAMQQVGYQVGDFLVQVQSGTNAMVAFGQQATQLVGVLPMFGSVAGISGNALIGLTAALGIAIPLVTALGAAWMRTRASGERADEAFKDLGTTLDALDDVRLDNLNKGIADGARAAAAEYERVLTLMERVEARALQSILRNQATAVETMIQNQRTLQDLAARAGAEFNFEVLGLDSFNEAIFLATQLRTLTGETREELIQQVTAIEEALTLRGLMNPQVEALIAKLAEEVGLTEAARDAIEEKAAAMEESVTLADTFRSIMEGISIDGLLSQMDTLNSQLGSAIFGAGTMSARLRGLFDAGVAAAERAAYAQQIGGGRSMGRGGPTAEEIQNYDPRAQIAYTPGGAAGIPLPRIPGRRGGGGSGGAAAAQDDYLKNLLLEAEQKRKLVGLSEEETRRQEILFELKKRDLLVNDALSEQQALMIEQIVQEEAQKRRLMELEQQREQLMQTIENNISNAFMSMVDGSASVEDAFRNMLRNILLAVYEQQVATPAATAISGLIGKVFGLADGGAFNRGVQFFADGGVVNSPTMFQHSGGLGVMGEAGPEAILPLKRGANGKLGVQMEGNADKPVIVQQYFQLSANGDESVRRIVRQEAPRMAEMAKAAVVDAKRRGGTYGRSF